ncbi:MAG: hypothetical protein ACR2JO_09920 [Mycobacteriales bacterium]
MTATAPRVPPGVRPAGARVWRAIVADYELDPHELSLLTQVVRTIDTLEDLAALVDKQGPLIEGRANPALVEARMQRIVLSRLLATLRVPLGDETDGRPQRRGAARGAYGLRSA